MFLSKRVQMYYYFPHTQQKNTIKKELLLKLLKCNVFQDEKKQQNAQLYYTNPTLYRFHSISNTKEAVNLSHLHLEIIREK
jgi:hypothetical protein